MAEVNGCPLPEDRLYYINPNKNAFIWVKEEGDGAFSIGLTSVAAAMAGRLVAYTPKKVGKAVKKDKSVATIESGKWVGPVPSPFDAEIVEVNDALKANPALVNDDPYGQGWIAKIKPADPEAAKAELVDANKAAELLQPIVQEKGVKCG
ncbi:glycine cleavage system protein H [Aquifex pyrophilus]